jgi:4'-phosphopantetheinyl transferase superfamily
LSSSAAGERAGLANLLWTAKEAAAKVRREGLRLDVRHAVVTPAPGRSPAGAWRALRVDWGDRAKATAGWWRSESGCVMTVAAEPPSGQPRRLG